MKLLLDTHAFLWLNDDVEQLSEKIKGLCSEGSHDFYLSIASAWEIQIKHQLGKLDLKVAVEQLIYKNQQENGIQLLPIELAHICHLKHLPQYHKDPFDRIIITQAIIENMNVITVDQAFSDYDVKTIW